MIVAVGAVRTDGILAHGGSVDSPMEARFGAGDGAIALGANRGKYWIGRRTTKEITMAVPRFMAHINKRVFNPRERRKGKRPVLSHVGRNSGIEYHTPMDAFPVEGGFLFIGLYGPKTDWIRNVMALGTASVRYGGDEIALGQPRLASLEEAKSLLTQAGHSPRTPNDGEYLVMATA